MIPSTPNTPIGRLRRVGIIEGISFLILVFIAMPLKYLADWPYAVKVFGWLHGVLFIWFCWVLLKAMLHARWPVWKAAIPFIAALIPFGPWLIDRHLEKEEAEAPAN